MSSNSYQKTHNYQGSSDINLEDKKPSSKFLTYTIVFSVILHIVVILQLTFDVFNLDTTPKKNNPQLEVVLVNSSSKNKPKEADKLAQVNMDGGGNVEDNRIAKSPIPVFDKAIETNQISPEQEAQRKVERLENEAQQLLGIIRYQNNSVNSATTNFEKQQKSTDGNTSSLEEEQKALEASRLHAQIEKSMELYQKRPRRKFVGSRVQEYAFAQYVEDWRVKVERIGNFNYPTEAKQNHIYGSLQLSVSINSDGSIEKIDLARSSGSKILDEAAIRIVKLASPFSPFSPEMKKQIDILSITRTWSFTKADGFSAE